MDAVLPEAPGGAGRASAHTAGHVVTICCRLTELAKTRICRDVFAASFASMPDTLVTPCILLADDQPDVLDALRLLLKTAGFETDSASSIATVRDCLFAPRSHL